MPQRLQMWLVCKLLIILHQINATIVTVEEEAKGGREPVAAKPPAGATKKRGTAAGVAFQKAGGGKNLITKLSKPAGLLGIVRGWTHYSRHRARYDDLSGWSYDDNNTLMERSTRSVMYRDIWVSHLTWEGTFGIVRTRVEERATVCGDDIGEGNTQRDRDLGRDIVELIDTESQGHRGHRRGGGFGVDLGLGGVDWAIKQAAIDSKGFLEFFDCLDPQQGVEDLRELLHKVLCLIQCCEVYITRLNIEKLDGNIVQKHGGLKQVGFKQLGPSVETGVHGVHDEKRVWFEVELQGAQGERETEVFQVFWAEDTTRSTYLVNRLPSSVIGFKKPMNMLGFFSWLASIKQGMLEPVKVRCIFLGYYKSIVGNKLWRLDDVTSKVVLYMNIGFNNSGEYKKTFIGSGVGTGSMQVLQGDEFEVEPQDDHTFEVEPHRNVDHVVGSQEVQTQDLIYYHPAVEKIYAHESLTFNNTVACEVISKWKAGLKDDMDARSDVYVLNNGCKKCSDDSDCNYWESTPGDCDVEKNGKWSCIYAVGSQDYQMVCTRLDIASADVGMLDKFDRGLQTDVQVFVDFDYAMAAYMTLTEAAKEAIWLKGLAIESGFELKIVASIATGALSKAIPGSSILYKALRLECLQAPGRLYVFDKRCRKINLRLAIKKINHIFLSHICSETTGGLSGLLLTLVYSNEEGVNVWRPSDF
ncbi:hypothetical protein Tco_0558557 [Tanacetum coccineum]